MHDLQYAIRQTAVPTVWIGHYVLVAGVYYEWDVIGAAYVTLIDGSAGGGGAATPQRGSDSDILIVTDAGTGTGIALFDRIERISELDLSVANPTVLGVLFRNIDQPGATVVIGTATYEGLLVGKQFNVHNNVLAVALVSIALPAATGRNNRAGLQNTGDFDVYYTLDGSAPVTTTPGSSMVIAAGGTLELSDTQITQARFICAAGGTSTIRVNFSYEIREPE